jgi:hypothetical protein
MKVALTIVGLLLIATALQDQFQSLFHPAGRGVMSDFIARIVWKICRTLSGGRPGPLSLAGPIALLLIIGTWVTLLTFGYAIMFRVHDGDFAPLANLDALRHRTFLDYLDISFAGMVTVATEVFPTHRFLRAFAISESFLGIGLVTASVSWLLGIYPALERRSSTAQQGVTIYETERETGIPLLSLPENYVQGVLLEIAAELTGIRNEVVQFPITYFFGVHNERASLSRILPYIDHIAVWASQDQERPSIRFAGTILKSALCTYLDLIAKRFLNLPCGDYRQVMTAYASDNNQEVLPVKSTQN